MTLSARRSSSAASCCTSCQRVREDSALRLHGQSRSPSQARVYAAACWAWLTIRLRRQYPNATQHSDLPSTAESDTFGAAVRTAKRAACGSLNNFRRRSARPDVWSWPFRFTGTPHERQPPRFFLGMFLRPSSAGHGSPGALTRQTLARKATPPAIDGPEKTELDQRRLACPPSMDPAVRRFGNRPDFGKSFAIQSP